MICCWKGTTKQIAGNIVYVSTLHTPQFFATIIQMKSAQGALHSMKLDNFYSYQFKKSSIILVFFNTFTMGAKISSKSIMKPIRFQNSHSIGQGSLPHWAGLLPLSGGGLSPPRIWWASSTWLGRVQDKAHSTGELCYPVWWAEPDRRGGGRGRTATPAFPSLGAALLPKKCYQTQALIMGYLHRKSNCTRPVVGDFVPSFRAGFTRPEGTRCGNTTLREACARQGGRTVFRAFGGGFATKNPMKPRQLWLGTCAEDLLRIGLVVMKKIGFIHTHT